MKRFKTDFYARVIEDQAGWIADVRRFTLHGHYTAADAWATVRHYAQELLDAATEAEIAACRSQGTDEP